MSYSIQPDTNNTANPFHASWSEKGNMLCNGHWQISFQGLPFVLPSTRERETMGTWGIYSFIYDDDPDFAEGEKEEAWVVNNAEWLVPLFIEQDIPADPQHLSWFYQAVNKDDWRCGSCGGCL